ncbi:hypothetical protein IFT73_17460 [Aeromicrobium sp. CFBP 8757]|uniref:hypothetical protein n=1 Tax=Aeromicrobium sp. CFBP 8757 TaxID=2775288 RepID=UPI00178471FA|nr:hypothetical protein [Aeromicrobium sp. CFBP 8757]MBD8608645.1 hypothetical protein [Aeromicrobium sp. CFBP 8757]
MAMPTSVWHEYGFRGNPYSTDPIEVSAAGRELLIGREQELALIGRHLTGGASVVALEGDFGVGKTSLAAVAAFDAAQWSKEGGPLFLAMDTRLSLRPEDTRESFERRVVRAVAHVLVANAGSLKSGGRPLDGVEGVKRWLQAPEAGGWNASLGANVGGVAGGNAGFGKARTPNTSTGFAELGIAEIVDGWLAQLFPNRDSGGVLCFLDNLEELNDSGTALNVMEPLRDPLFKRPGLRWIISGAQGMVRAAYASPKMAGVFLNPIDVRPLPHKLVPQVIFARMKALQDQDDAVAPVSMTAFANLYRSIGQNLRYALNLSERYAFDSDPDELRGISEADRDLRFHESVLREADLVYAAQARDLGAADWKVFDHLLRSKAGSCSPSEYKDFGYAQMPPLLSRVRKLTEAHLVSYQIDEADQRRRTISVTDHGRLAYYRHVNDA